MEHTFSGVKELKKKKEEEGRKREVSQRISAYASESAQCLKRRVWRPAWKNC